MNFQKHNKEEGFTLIEMVLATALFASVVVATLGVYISTSRIDTRTRAQRTVVQNGRFIMEFFEKEITNGHIDYSHSNDSSNLYVINQAGDSEHFALNPNNNCSTAVCNIVLTKGSSAPTNMNSSSVRVTNLKFILNPAVDPMTPAKNANEQPHVTVIMQLTANSSRDAYVLNLEDTFSELYYPSRQ